MEIRTVIRHFNVFSHSFRYGFWTLRAVSRWYSGWRGEMGYGWGTGFRGGYHAGRRLPVSVRQPARPSPAPSGGQIVRKVLHLPLSATICPYLGHPTPPSPILRSCGFPSELACSSCEAE